MIYLLGDHHLPLTTALLEPAWLPSAPRKRTLLDEMLATTACLLEAPRPLDRAGHAFTTSSISIRFDKDNSDYVVEAPTPGVKRDELKLEVVGDRRLELIIDQGDNQQDTNKEGDEKKETAEGAPFVRKFFGSVVLPEDADTASPRVEYVDGVLRVRFAKLEGDKKLAIGLDGEHAELAAEVSRRLDKVKELRAQLEAEAAEAAKAEDKLRRARAEAAKQRSAKRERLL